MLPFIVSLFVVVVVVTRDSTKISQCHVPLPVLYRDPNEDDDFLVTVPLWWVAIVLGLAFPVRVE